MSALKDKGVVHRLAFAARSLPRETPSYWDIVTSFGIGESSHTLSPEDTRIFIENMEILNKDVFQSDSEMIRRLIEMPRSDHGKVKKVGIILISPNKHCPKCQSQLYLRPDRSVTTTIYDHQLGTIPGQHYTKYCRQLGCHYNQHYGYHTNEESGNVVYDFDCFKLPYFMSSRETAFSFEILKHFDLDCLIGQVSYKQAADIYNYYQHYEMENK